MFIPKFGPLQVVKVIHGVHSGSLAQVLKCWEPAAEHCQATYLVKLTTGWKHGEEVTFLEGNLQQPDPYDFGRLNPASAMQSNTAHSTTPLTVADLREMLAQYPDSTPIVAVSRDENDFVTLEGVEYEKGDYLYVDGKKYDGMVLSISGY